MCKQIEMFLCKRWSWDVECPMAGHSRFYHPSQAAQEVGSLVSMTTWLPIGMGYHTHAAFYCDSSGLARSHS